MIINILNESYTILLDIINFNNNRSYKKYLSSYCTIIHKEINKHIDISTNYIKEYIENKDTILLIYAIMNMCHPKIIKLIKKYTDPNLYNKNMIEDIIKWNYIKYISFVSYKYFFQHSYQYISTGQHYEYTIKEQLRDFYTYQLIKYCELFDIEVPYYLDIELDDEVDDNFNDQTMTIIKDIINQYGV